MSWLIGEHAIGDLLRHAPQAIDRILIDERSRDARLDALVELASTHGLSVERVPGKRLQTRAGGRAGARVAASLVIASPKALDELTNGDNTPLALALDGVTDPHNLGAILRTANAFGVGAVVAPKNRSAPLNDAAIRASAGAAALLPPTRVTNLSRALADAKKHGYWVIGLDADGAQNLDAVDLTIPSVLVLGDEGRGLRPGVRKVCDVIARIPLSGQVSSLNVSVSAAVAIYEAHRQRSSTPGQ